VTLVTKYFGIVVSEIRAAVVTKHFANGVVLNKRQLLLCRIRSTANTTTRQPTTYARGTM